MFVQQPIACNRTGVVLICPAAAVVRQACLQKRLCVAMVSRLIQIRNSPFQIPLCPLAVSIHHAEKPRGGGRNMVVFSFFPGGMQVFYRFGRIRLCHGDSILIKHAHHIDRLLIAVLGRSAEVGKRLLLIFLHAASCGQALRSVHHALIVSVLRALAHNLIKASLRRVAISLLFHPGEKIERFHISLFAGQFQAWECFFCILLAVLPGEIDSPQQ